jgi:hypothetical protein
MNKPTGLGKMKPVIFHPNQFKTQSGPSKTFLVQGRLSLSATLAMVIPSSAFFTISGFPGSGAQEPPGT